jgi:hypothetical protein
MNRLIPPSLEECFQFIINNRINKNKSIGESYGVHKINRIEFKCSPLIYEDDWKEQLGDINTKEELEDFISKNISITFNLKGKNTKQLVFPEDDDVLNGNKKITIKGNHTDILDNFSWGT